VWSVIGGALPPGLTLSAGGLLSGAPTTPGAYTFLIDVDGREGKRLPFRVQRPPAPAPSEVSSGGYL